MWAHCVGRRTSESLRIFKQDFGKEIVGSLLRLLSVARQALCVWNNCSAIACALTDSACTAIVPHTTLFSPWMLCQALSLCQWSAVLKESSCSLEKAAAFSTPRLWRIINPIAGNCGLAVVAKHWLFLGSCTEVSPWAGKPWPLLAWASLSTVQVTVAVCSLQRDSPATLDGQDDAVGAAGRHEVYSCYRFCWTALTKWMQLARDLLYPLSFGLAILVLVDAK